MRFRSLHLKAFGSFTDRRLEFGEGPAKVNIVLGQNEAGKSTTLRAIESFCFGIDNRTKDNFLHPNNQLLIGAEIEMADGSNKTFYRRKGSKNTVLGRDEKQVPDEFLTQCLCGIGQAGFEALFCLNFDRIASESESLLSEGGEVGRLLFEARSDLNLKPILAELQDRSQKLFKGTAKASSVIDVALRNYDKARKDSRSGDIAEYLQQEKNLKRLTEEAEDARKNFDNLTRDQKRLSRIQSAFVPVIQRKSILVQLHNLGEVIPLPDSFGSDVETFLKQYRQSTTQIAFQKDELARWEGELENLPSEDPILNWDEQIRWLNEQVGDITRMWKDLPDEEEKIRKFTELKNQEIARFWKTLDAAPKSESLSDREKSRIRELQQVGTGIRSKISTYEGQIEDLKTRILELNNRLSRLPEPEIQEGFGRVIQDAKALGDIDRDIRQLELEIQASQARSNDLLKRLALTAYSLEQVVELDVPLLATIHRFDITLAKQAETIERIENRIQADKVDRAQAMEDLTALNLAGAVPTEAELLEARKIRDELWSQMRTNPNGLLRDPYEESVQNADALADRLRREAERSSQRARLEAILLTTDNSLASNEGELQLAKATLDTSASEWNCLWAESGVSVLTPKEMIEWHVHFDTLRNEIQKLFGMQKNLAVLTDRRQTVLTAIHAVVATKGDQLSSALAHAEDAFQVSNGQRKARNDDSNNLQSESNRLTALENDLNQEQDRLNKWRLDWQVATAPLQLGADLNESEANQALEILEKASQHEAAGNSAQKRAAGMVTSIGIFEHHLKEVAQSLNYQSELNSVAQTRHLVERLESAKSHQRNRLQLNTELNRVKREMNQADQERRSAQARLESLCAIAGCRNDEELVPAQQRYEEYVRLRKQLEDVNSNIQALSGNLSVEDFVAEVEAADPDDISVRIEWSQRDLDQSSSNLDDLNQKIGEARRVLDDSETTGTLLNARILAEGELAKARSAVRPYLVYSLAEGLVAAQVEEYRKANQGPLLEKAGSIFSIITGGSFLSLTSDLNDKDDQVLQAVRSNGEKVLVEGLSSATRMGLYIALRIACLHHHAETRECLPFIADDILMDFDNDRAECAFEVLGDLAQKTQVIFLTHHAHLAAIGTRVLGDRACLINLSR